MPADLNVRAVMVFAAAVIILFATFVASAQISNDDLLPSGKKSDGCTLIPDGDIKGCCVAHDRDYYWGGTFRERRQSDKKLFFCIRNKPGIQHRIFAPFIWLGVRIG